MAANSCKQMNTVYTDLSANTRTIQKDINDEQFMLKDSLSKIKWRITGATQDILGYTCREAHGVMLDSVYIVAFFTDKIWVGGGPESFSGLPGMILKLVLPHEHISWTATKVTEEVPATAIEPPKKGKPITNTQLNVIINNNAARSPVANYERKLFLL
jgi:GLPGLI family protein